jgi:hypothetical protein
MRLYMVRRTRSFIRDNYAVTEEKTGRRYLVLDDGSRSFFPTRVPKKVEYSIGDYDDPYARLYSDPVVDAINRLSLPRYGLANYIAKQPPIKPTADEQKQLQGLGRAGKRLMGFSRTNLFKRLESGGPAYLQSIDRHILRNYIVLHAIENDKPLPLGTQNAALLDSATFDDDVDAAIPLPFDEEETSEQQEDADGETQIGPRDRLSGARRRPMRCMPPSLNRASSGCGPAYSTGVTGDAPGCRRAAPDRSSEDLRHVGCAQRCQACRAGQFVDADAPAREGFGLHAVCRYRPLSQERTSSARWMLLRALRAAPVTQLASPGGSVRRATTGPSSQKTRCGCW